MYGSELWNRKNKRLRIRATQMDSCKTMIKVRSDSIMNERIRKLVSVFLEWMK